MFEVSLGLLFLALLLDWWLGEPDFLWSRFPHPVVIFGKAVGYADKRLNIASDTDAQKYKKGAFAIIVLILLATTIGVLFEMLIDKIGWPLYLLELLIVFVLLAQRSLYEHVEAVASGLRDDGLAGGQRAVGMIVGRDPETLNTSGVSRAAIESLAENFSDGVVAPAFWYLVFGLPGIFAYKMINTADSMIAYRSEKYLWFGRAAAKIDDLANWVPARISAGLIALAAGLTSGPSRSLLSIKGAFRDAGLHRSPNAGWPEGAMASAIDVALGGPRNYADEQVPQAYLNAAGKHELRAEDIRTALSVFAAACFVGWAIVLVLMFLF